VTKKNKKKEEKIWEGAEKQGEGGKA